MKVAHIKLLQTCGMRRWGHVNMKGEDYVVKMILKFEKKDSQNTSTET